MDNLAFWFAFLGLVLPSALWVFVDAHSLGVKRGALGGGLFDLGPGGWCLATLLLWCVGFPIDVGLRPLYSAAANKRARVS